MHRSRANLQHHLDRMYSSLGIVAHWGGIACAAEDLPGLPADDFTPFPIFFSGQFAPRVPFLQHLPGPVTSGRG